MKVCSNCGKDVKGSYCRYCANKRYRERHPIRAAFLSLRNNAKRRKKEFTLTFEEFETFAQSTTLMYKRGRSKDSFTVERIDARKGYTLDNITVLTKSENSRKGATEDKKILSINRTSEGKDFKFIGDPYNVRGDEIVEDTPF